MSAQDDLAPASLPGIDRERVGAWLRAEVDDLEPPFDYELIAGGMSNLTFRVRDGAGREVVLRRPPLGPTLPSAHDMEREFRIIEALDGSIVPVPTPFGLCVDAEVNGAPFYVMEFLSGAVLKSVEAAERAYPDPADRRRLAESLIGVLASLHSIEPGEVGLGDLGRRDGYIERQLARWQRQWEQAKTREVPAIDDVHDRLAAAIPAEQRASIVHGDYRLDNVVSGPGPRVAGVLDWELCTLGDPLADLGGLMTSWIEPGETAAHLMWGSVTSLPGFPTRGELIDAYAARSGLDVSRVDYYMAFTYWKLACIAEGVYRRFSTGMMGDGAGVSLVELGEKTEILAELAAASLR